MCCEANAHETKHVVYAVDTIDDDIEWKHVQTGYAV